MILILTSDFGMIAPFDREKCPEGWSEYIPARGRMIIGSGGNFSNGNFGGASEITIQNQNIPEHYHYIFGVGDHLSGALANFPETYAKDRASFHQPNGGVLTNENLNI
jgi:hypothetical protein